MELHLHFSIWLHGVHSDNFISHAFMCVTSPNTYHTGRCFEQKLQITTYTPWQVCTISQNPEAISKSSVPEDDIKQITYQGLRKISRQHTKFSRPSNVAPRVCASLWLYIQHNCPVYLLLFLEQLNGMMCHRTTREMLTDSVHSSCLESLHK